MNLINENSKSPLLAFIKLEPTFLTGSLAVFVFSLPLPAYSSGRQGESGRKGVVFALPPAEPSQFGSDIFKQTPPERKMQLRAGRLASLGG